MQNLYKLVILLFICNSSLYSSNWEFQNPIPTSNTVRSIHFMNSDTGFVVGSNGVFLVTYDGGISWNNHEVTNISDLSYYNLHCIDFISDKTGFILASSSIFKTNDGGETWSGTRYGYQDFYDFDFSTETTGYAVGYYGTIYKTVNKGETWYKINLSVTTKNLNDIQFVDSLNGFIAGDDGIFLKTTDGGVSWLNISNSSYSYEDLNSIFFKNSNEGYIATNIGNIYYTTNGGNSWITLFREQPLTSIVFLNNELGYATNYLGGIYKTVNKGYSWVLDKPNKTIWDYSLYSLKTFGDSVVFAVGASGRIFKSMQGNPWEEVSSGIINNLRSISFVDSVNGIAVGDNGTIYKTLNSGKNWDYIIHESLENFQAATYAGVDTGFIVGSSGIILKTTNNANTWTNLSFETSTNYNSVQFLNTDLGFIAGNNGTILKTINGGENWISQNTGTIQKLNSIFFLNELVGYAVGAVGTIIGTNDGGLNWSLINSGSNAELKSIKFTNDSIGFISGNSSHILKSINGGTSWSLKNIGSGMRLNSIQMVDEDFGYAVGQVGYIYSTSNGGQTWIRTYESKKTINELYSICSNSQHDVFAVGQLGTILHYSCNELKHLGSIIGPSNVCTGSTEIIYSIPSNSEIDEYKWNLESEISGYSTADNISVDFGTNLTNNIISVTGKNYCSLSPTSTSEIDIVDCTSATITRQACDTYTSPSGKVLTSSGFYIDTIKNHLNTDSLIYIYLTIVSNTFTEKYYMACDTFIAPSGNKKWSVSGTYLDTLITDMGCDSVLSINLTINKSTTSSIIETACKSYASPSGNVWTASDIFTDTIPNAVGCDSIITIDLTINNSSTSNIAKTVCDSYTSPSGKVWTVSDIYTDTIPNAAGCDSIITINLTINNNTTGIDVQSACDSFTWIDGITYTESNNVASHTLTNAAGCDSVVTLNLTIKKSTSSVQNITTINSYTWIDGITYTENNNTATHTILNNQGCDSVITLNLTITVPVEPLTVTVNTKNVQCFGESTGTAALSVVGGVAPYLYKWSNGSTTQNQTGLIAGNYIVTVSDAKESKSIKEITISEPSTLLSVSGNSDHVKCKGDATGSITLQVEGGVEPYTYKWSNGFTTKNISQLKANNYTVTVSDSNGCTITQKYTISQPANALMVYGIPKKSDCDGDATGKITLTVSGGVQPYSYNWSNGSDEKDQTLLATGNYGVTVTDTNQCLEVWNTTISQQSKASFKGIAKYSGGFIEAGDASVFLYDVQHNMNDSIWEVRMQDNGVFEFTDIPVGQYYVYVKLDENVKQKYKDVSHTYYKQTFKWNEAKTFDLSCGDISSIVLNMVEFPASAMGTSSVSGKVVKDNKGLKSSFPPIENVDVMLINLLRNTPVASVITNEDGYYEIGEIAEGDYALYINSPGISQKSTYTFSVYKKTTSFSNMDFEIDMDENFEFNTINLSATNIESSGGQFDLITYPNPANNYVIISTDYIKNKEAEITLFSNLGVVIQKQKLYAGENHTNEFKFELSNVVSGAYILKIECEKSVSIKNIIVIK